MLRLPDIQQRLFRRLTRPHASGDGDGALVAEIRRHGPLDVDERLAIYARMYCARLVDALGEELPLGHRRLDVGQVTRDVLDQDLSLEPRLNPLDPLHHVRQRLVGVRQRQEVVRVVTTDASPAEMIGDPGRLHAVRERCQVVQVIGA
jgi:hypothetical protein